MGLARAFFHSLVHLSLALFVFFLFSLRSEHLLLVLLASALIDLDHLPLFLRKGINYWIEISWKRQKPQAYPLHNFITMSLFLALSSFIFVQPLFLVGILSLCIFLHLAWDLFEDVFIFKIGIEHWKCGRWI